MALTLAVRVGLCLLWPTPPSWDGHFYARLAAQLARGAGYVEPLAHGDVATAFWPPGLPFALLGPIALGASASLAAVLVNLAAAVVAVVAVYRAAESTHGRPSPFRAARLYALYPGLALWSTAAMTETLTGALLAVALLIALRRNAFVAGVVLGLAALTRPPSLLLLVAPLVAARGGAGSRSASSARSPVIAPWTARNARALDGPALISTNGGSNLLIGATSAHGGYTSPRAGTRGVRPPSERSPATAAGARRPWRRSVGPPARGRCAGPCASRAPSPSSSTPPPTSRGATARRPAPVRFALGALCTLAWWALLLRAARGLPHSPDARVVTLAVVAAALTHFVFLGADRYHLVLVPLLCPLAARSPR